MRSTERKILLLTAAILHDTDYIEQYDKNEPIGARIAGKLLPKYGYFKEEIETVKDLILTTQMPQKPQNHLQHIICDADLGNLGREDFFDKGEALRK